MASDVRNEKANKPFVIDGLSEEEAKKDAVVIVMRHSKRVDQHPKLCKETYQEWVDSNERYDRVYDPPICDYTLPIIAAKEICQLLPNFVANAIVTSPFRRCIETSALLAKHFNINKFIIDNRIAEDNIAINRCVKSAQRMWRTEIDQFKSQNKHLSNKNDSEIAAILKRPINEPFKGWKIKDAYKKIEFLSENEMKKIIRTMWSFNDKNEKLETKENENDKNDKEMEMKIDLIWKENGWPVASQREFLHCCDEYIKNGGNVIMVTHGDIVTRLIENKCNGMLAAPNECSWFVTAHFDKAPKARYIRYHASKNHNVLPNMQILLEPQT